MSHQFFNWILEVMIKLRFIDLIETDITFQYATV